MASIAVQRRLAALPRTNVECVWSLYMENEATSSLNGKSARTALEKTGACVWIDHDSCIGARVVVAGSTGCVASARLVVESLVVAFMNKPESSVPDWALAQPFYTPLEYSSPQPIVSAVAEPAVDELVHFTQQVPLQLMGLVIGVKGASIHAMEQVSACHLSLDRSIVHNEESTGLPFVLLHIHGAIAAVNMCSAILARHLASVLEAAPGAVTQSSTPTHPPALPAPIKLASLKVPKHDEAIDQESPTAVVDSRAFDSPPAAYGNGGSFGTAESTNSDDSAGELSALPAWGFVVETGGKLKAHRYPTAVQSAA